MKTPYLTLTRRPVVNSYLRREHDRQRRRELLLLGLALLPLAAGLFLYTWVELETLAAGFRIDALERDLAELERRSRELALEESILGRSERVEQRARASLGMVPQSLEQTVYWAELEGAAGSGDLAAVDLAAVDAPLPSDRSAALRGGQR